MYENTEHKTQDCNFIC